MKCSRRSSPFGLALVATAIALSSACAESVEVKPATLDEGPGLPGPFAVEQTGRAFRVRVDQTVDTEVFRPMVANDVGLDAAPLAVVVQGGLVPIERYRWIAIHLASRGMIVALPQHPLDLAFFGQPNPIDVADALRAASTDVGDPLFGAVDDAPALVVGHSLGGVVAAKAWTFAPNDFSRLVMFAGIPDPADVEANAQRAGGRVLSIVGSEDSRIGPDEVVEGAAPYGVKATVVVVEGMNHYQFTDGATEEELATDGESTVSLEVGRQRALFLLDAFISDLVNVPGSDPSVLVRPQSWPTGLSLAAPAASTNRTEGGAQ